MCILKKDAVIYYITVFFLYEILLFKVNTISVNGIYYISVIMEVVRKWN